MTTRHQDAFEDLVALADWAGGKGNCGVWTERQLAGRWGWTASSVRRYLLRCERRAMLKRVMRSSGTNIILLIDRWELESASLPRVPRTQIRQSEQIALTVICTYFDVTETHVRGLLSRRSKKRGRPSRARRDQDAVSLWLYLVNTSGGFSALQIRSATGMHHRAIQHMAAAIEDKRDNDPTFNEMVMALEAAYATTDKVLRKLI